MSLKPYRHAVPSSPGCRPAFVKIPLRQWAIFADKPSVKRATTHRTAVFLTLWGAWALGWGGCSTTQVAPMPTLPETPPDYVKVPHPEGLNLGDLMAIFTDREAPAPDALVECDKDWNKLKALTQSKEELNQGARELVRQDPVRYHWCFYSKLMQLEEGLKADTYLDERQKRVVDSYLFLGPIARGFMDEFHDSRYLRWAIARYRRLSEYVFYRRVELSPQMASDLAQAENPFGLMRPAKDYPGGILHKYGLLEGIEHGPALIGDPLMAAQGEVIPAGEISPATESAQDSATAAPHQGQFPGDPLAAPKNATVEIDRKPAATIQAEPKAPVAPAVTPPVPASQPEL